MTKDFLAKAYTWIGFPEVLTSPGSEYTKL